MAFSKALQRKLLTNDAPTKEEALIVHKVLAASLSKVAVLEGETLRLQSELNSLAREKQQLSVFVSEHKGLLSPARRLLPEILQEIFYYCLPTAHNALMSSKEAPLLLGQVCRQWRQIAYGSPKLWTSIHIIPIPSRCTVHPLDVARREAISAWLSRSGVLPLSISVFASGQTMRRYGRSRRCPSNSRVQPYLDLIIPYARRWRSVYLFLPYFDWVDFLSKLDGSRLSILESLHFEGDRPRRMEPEVPSVCPLSRTDSILNALSLRVISLPTFYSQLPDLKAPWKQITGLNLGTRRLALVDIVKVLRLCPNLEFCSVFVGSISQGNYVATPPSEPFEMTPLNVSRLQSFQVIVRSCLNAGTCSLLKGLTTPSLRHFSYKQTEETWWPDSPSSSTTSHLGPSSQLLTSFCSFLRRLTCPLEELELFVFPLSGILVMEILPCVPSLKRLSLKGLAPRSYGVDHSPPLSPGPTRPPNDFLLSHLIPGEIPSLGDSQLTTFVDSDDLVTTPSCLCPNLQVLHCVDAGISRQWLLKLLCSRTIHHRKHGLAHLRQVSVSISSQGIEEGHGFTKEIRVLEEETGVRVHVRYPSLRSTTVPTSDFPPPLPRAYLGVPVDLTPVSFSMPGLKSFRF